MKLIKLSSDHYIIVDENRDIHENDYTFKDGKIGEVSFLMQDNGHVITHSTLPIEPFTVDLTPTGLPTKSYVYDKVQKLSLLKVKELLTEVDVEALAKKEHYDGTIEGGYLVGGFINGYNQALEDNKDTKYTETDLRAVFMHGFLLGVDRGDYSLDMENRALSTYTQPPTSWNVEFVDGKLKFI